MAVIGCLGDIVFTVSDQTALFLNNFKWSGSARYSTHQRHNTNALTEFTGLDPDQISFDLIFTEEYGTSPRKELKKIWDYERMGATLPFTLGKKPYGKYRWTILDHNLDATNTDREGNLIAANVSIKLQEYLRS